jgi:diguanylate cyclase (GGDEF)-like protein/PAS domain S-box-containing protein
MSPDVMKQRARAFEYLFDAVIVTDLSGMIIDWNLGSEKLYGYSTSEAIGCHVSILHASEDITSLAQEVIAAVEKDGQWSGEIKMRHKDGTIGWVESVAVPLYDDEGAISGALGIYRDISERIRDKERLAYLAHHDQLTGLPNRYLLIERLERMIVQAERNNRFFALLFIDLDNFKEINDTAGHAAGDRILKRTAQLLKQALRNSDTVARLGGDEFVVLLSQTRDREDVDLVIKHLCSVLHNDISLGETKVPLTASIGLATYPSDGTTSDALLSCADHAMYEAKKVHKNGKKRFTLVPLS